ncbi:putative allantoicase [Rhizocola hellebori]|uniref:Probable allantoicase n=1 Tax=Rhizocola hellebori TaxID=1392758 RepID=A0A8J3VGR6_9ACTN|nr:allantoicase [Rhizocola hellebori]GIH05442.1 putative allantoicase [Rhizocola hellebori]
MSYVDLASRALGGAVVAANDESFCAADHLIDPRAPVFSPQTFDHNGQIYDGWETRRRREPGHDWAIVRLAAPGIVREMVVDTAFFKGNYPPQCSLSAARVQGYRSAAELSDVPWTPLVELAAVKGDTANTFAVNDDATYTHVRLAIHPDGGVARLRVHGEVVPDLELLSLVPSDLAALVNGGRAIGCSDAFFSSPNNMLMPGLARTTGEGWENRRRRDDGHDWALIQLAAPGRLLLAELDTTHFKFNAPGWAELVGHTADGQQATILPKTRLQPDTLHRFRLPSELPAVERVQLNIFPDGGIARLRLIGTPSPAVS